MTKNYLCMTVLLGTLWQSTQAAQPPTGGQLLQEIPVLTPPVTPTAPAITVIRPDAGSAAPGAEFLVRQIEVSGNAAIPTAQIRVVVAPSEGKMLTLADLQRLADDITGLYLKRGYPFSQAYVPVQTLQDGRVRIVVLEARYDSIVLRNRSRVRDSVAQASLSGLKPEMPVDQASLDRALLLASDLPATEVKGTLRPGRTAGASELLVDIDPGPSTKAYLSADDYGNAATGRERLGANLSWNNPLHAGDVLSLGALSSGNGMSYGRLGYQVPVHGPATQIDAHVSSLGYRVVNGSEAGLEAHGIARVFGIGLQQVLLRATDANVTAQLGYDHTLLRDHIDVSVIRTDRHVEDWRASVGGSFSDRTGFSTFSAGLTRGRVVFDDATALQVDGAGARTGGPFFKYVLSVSRVQRLNATTALSLAVNYQGADKNLDSSEQMFVGGPSSVRAYDNGVVSGTQGDSVSLELQHDLVLGAKGRWQGVAFVDNAHVQIEKSAYASGINGATLSGAGVGLNWAGAGGWWLQSAVAVPIGPAPAVIGHGDSLRAWVKVQKEF